MSVVSSALILCVCVVGGACVPGGVLPGGIALPLPPLYDADGGDPAEEGGRRNEGLHVCRSLRPQKDLQVHLSPLSLPLLSLFVLCLSSLLSLCVSLSIPPLHPCFMLIFHPSADHTMMLFKTLSSEDIKKNTICTLFCITFLPLFSAVYIKLKVEHSVRSCLQKLIRLNQKRPKNFLVLKVTSLKPFVTETYLKTDFVNKHLWLFFTLDLSNITLKYFTRSSDCLQNHRH